MFCNRNLNFNEEIKTNKVEKKFCIKFEIKILELKSKLSGKGIKNF